MCRVDEQEEKIEVKVQFVNHCQLFSVGVNFPYAVQNLLEIHQAIACCAENTNLCPIFGLKGTFVLPSLPREPTSNFSFRDRTLKQLIKKLNYTQLKISKFTNIYTFKRILRTHLQLRVVVSIPMKYKLIARQCHADDRLPIN